MGDTDVESLKSKSSGGNGSVVPTPRDSEASKILRMLDEVSAGLDSSDALLLRVLDIIRKLHHCIINMPRDYEEKVQNSMKVAEEKVLSKLVEIGKNVPKRGPVQTNHKAILKVAQRTYSFLTVGWRPSKNGDTSDTLKGSSSSDSAEMSGPGLEISDTQSEEEVPAWATEIISKVNELSEEITAARSHVGIVSKSFDSRWSDLNSSAVDICTRIGDVEATQKNLTAKATSLDAIASRIDQKMNFILGGFAAGLVGVVGVVSLMIYFKPK
jgi:flagellin-like hook-associated protein FlgL